MQVDVRPAAPGDPDGIDPRWIERWLTIVADRDGGQHAVLSDGRHHIRLDMGNGRLCAGQPVVLHYHLHGIGSAARRILPLRRLLQLLRDRHFPIALFPVGASSDRGVLLLRVRDALDAKASQREIARALFGDERVEGDRGRGSDSLRSRVRRLVRDARAMTMGGYRSLLRNTRR